MEWEYPEHYPRKHVPAGTILFYEGDPGTNMYLIVDGSLQVSKRLVEGSEKVLGTLGSGQYVGEMSLLTGAKRSATVQAVMDAQVIEIDRDAFLELLHHQPQLGLDIMRQMAHRLEHTNEEVVLLALEVALVQRQPRRQMQQRQRMRFVATGSFVGDRTSEVLRVASEQSEQTPHPALVSSLLLPGRTQQALIYLIETNNPRDIMELIAPFADLVQWDVAPALTFDEILPTPEGGNALP
jgi:CRP-like cAMP-binding protein